MWHLLPFLQQGATPQPLLDGTNNQLVAATILSQPSSTCLRLPVKGIPTGWAQSAENAVAAIYTKNRDGVLAAAAICFCRNGRESNDGGNQCSVHQALSKISLGNRGRVSTFQFAGAC